MAHPPSSPGSTKAWAVPLLLAAATAGGGYWADAVVRSVSEDRVIEQLRLGLEANERSLELWMAAQESTVRLVAENPSVVALASALVAAGAEPGATPDKLRARPDQLEFRRQVVSGALARGHGGASLEGVVGGALTDMEGRILAALDAARVGMRHEAFGDQAILRVLAGEALVLHPHRTAGGSDDARVEMSVAAPVSDDRGVFGALIFRLRPEVEFTRMLNSTRFGASGESYAFDRNGLALSDSRFPEQVRALGLIPEDRAEGTILNLSLRDPGGDLTQGFRPPTPKSEWPLSRMVVGALEGRAGLDTKGYRDYRGVKVVGAWTWLDRHDLGLVTKVDHAEAYATLGLLRRAFGLLIALLASAALGLLAYTRLAGRLGRDLRRAQKLGHYTLEHKIGQGGMGAVYRARHALLRRPTAVKLIRADRVSTEMLARFEREVQVTSQLTHPNTIAVFDFGRAGDGTFYYAMEYLDGVTLDRLVAGEGALDARRALHLVRQLCGSLAEAHAQGLIHRDIKPANVMLCVRGLVYDFVKVLDFGLAKEAAGGGDGSLTSAGELTGTPLYMAPEMIRAPESASPRSDVYAVGAVAYYLLSGSQVFPGKTVMEILERHLRDAPIAPSERSGRPIDPALDRLVLRCLEKDPARRPGDARDVLVELDRIGGADRPWTQAEARAWWESRGEAYRRTLAGGPPTGAPDLEIELLDRISGTGGTGASALLEDGTLTRHARPQGQEERR
jgi:tRNA A-37 threonylcarbamoyl transferase component Bud32